MPYYPCKLIIHVRVSSIFWLPLLVLRVLLWLKAFLRRQTTISRIFKKHTIPCVLFWTFIMCKQDTFNVFQNVMHTRNLRAAWLGFYYVSRYHQHTPESAVFNPDTTVINIVSACRYICMWCISGLAIQQTYIWIH